MEGWEFTSGSSLQSAWIRAEYKREQTNLSASRTNHTRGSVGRARFLSASRVGDHQFVIGVGWLGGTGCDRSA
ncbi:hypothetical protein AB1N83_013386 [Pleurotus pulmonarius]